MTDEIITVAPTIRTKGFKSENLRVIGASADDLEVAGALVRDLAGTRDTRLSNNDYRLLRLMARSYGKLRAGETPVAEDFVLSGHELLEYRLVAPSDQLRYLAYRYKYNKYPELKIVSAYPPCLQIEPTSICNYRCVMCYQSDKSFARKSHGYMGHMDFDLFTRVIDEVAGNIEAITFASRGEPLLHKDIARMLEYCQGKFLALKLNTNASILDERLIHALLSSDLQNLVFSIDAADEALYKKIRVGGDFKKVVRNLELFRDIRNREYSDSNIVVRISGVKLNDQQDIGEMEGFWGQFVDVIAFTNYNPWETSYDNPENVIEEPCTEFWRRMFVWWDGKINPCDFDYKSILSRWNFDDLSVSDVWTSSQYNAFREQHLAGQRGSLEPCHRCVAS